MLPGMTCLLGAANAEGARALTVTVLTAIARPTIRRRRRSGDLSMRFLHLTRKVFDGLSKYRLMSLGQDSNIGVFAANPEIAAAGWAGEGEDEGCRVADQSATRDGLP
ncbi:hypothetical protein GCM10023322_68870 [Rugosimonospora acidiphila]|uniref:Uncharacterized protein n=1 Tax=Rugosimonospora acidiphila TaxID=556531 RepID=A0ABP9SM41_9ACTN